MCVVIWWMSFLSTEHNIVPSQDPGHILIVRSSPDSYPPIQDLSQYLAELIKVFVVAGLKASHHNEALHNGFHANLGDNPKVMKKGLLYPFSFTIINFCRHFKRCSYISWLTENVTKGNVGSGKTSSIFMSLSLFCCNLPLLCRLFILQRLGFEIKRN